MTSINQVSSIVLPPFLGSVQENKENDDLGSFEDWLLNEDAQDAIEPSANEAGDVHRNEHGGEVHPDAYPVVVTPHPVLPLRNNQLIPPVLEEIKEGDVREDCGICMMEIGLNRVYTGCAHGPYHVACLRLWLVNHNTCMICHRELFPNIGNMHLEGGNQPILLLQNEGVHDPFNLAPVVPDNELEEQDADQDDWPVNDFIPNFNVADQPLPGMLRHRLQRVITFLPEQLEEYEVPLIHNRDIMWNHAMYLDFRVQGRFHRLINVPLPRVLVEELKSFLVNKDRSEETYLLLLAFYEELTREVAVPVESIELWKLYCPLVAFTARMHPINVNVIMNDGVDFGLRIDLQRWWRRSLWKEEDYWARNRISIIKFGVASLVVLGAGFLLYKNISTPRFLFPFYEFYDHVRYGQSLVVRVPVLILNYLRMLPYRYGLLGQVVQLSPYGISPILNELQ